MPILVLYFQDNGMSIYQVFLLQAIYSFVIVVFEVPSGYFADRVGRRTSIIAGVILAAFAMGIYAISTGFATFLIGEILFGLSAGFISGADSAILYESLLILKKEKEYKKLESKTHAIASFSEGAASLLGGWLALASLKLPFVVHTAVLFFVIPIAFSLKEPKQHEFEIAEGNWKEILSAVRFSLHENSKVKWLIIYSAVLGAASYSAVWFIQPYWKIVDMPLSLFGLMWALLQFTITIFALFATKLEEKLGKNNLMVLLLIATVLPFAVLYKYQTITASLIFFIFYIVRGIKRPLIYHYLNELIPSKTRATILSVKNLVTRMTFVLIGPLLGWINDTYSMQQAFLVGAVTFGIIGTISIFFFIKVKANSGQLA